MIRAGLPLLILILFANCAVSQSRMPAAAREVAGDIEIVYEHAAWPSPEKLAEDLRSRNDEVRLKALYLMGMTATQAHSQRWAQTSPYGIVGTEVATPDVIRLTYAALGEDTSQQAILAVAFEDSAGTFAAVATRAGQGWVRVAALDCWCKYETATSADVLSEFLRVVPASAPATGAPQHFELVVRTSSGGTGIYAQDEAHFRLREGELRTVLSFTSRQRSCNPTGPEPHFCYITRRWFYWTSTENVSQGRTGILVESRGRFSSEAEPPVDWAVRDLEIRHLKTTRCTSFEWNQQRFKYERQTTQRNACPQEPR